MTEGRILPRLILFALPFLIANVLQHTYNTADAFIVEMIMGKDAFNGVVQSGKVSQVMVNFFLGLGVGAGVVIAQYFGAKDKGNLKKAVHNTIIIGVFSGIVLTGLGLLLSKYILTAINTHEDVFPYAKEYLDIYFAGVIFLVLYNMGAGILRAVGDTLTPLIFLGITAVVNIFLDYFMTRAYGVAGAAWATVIAEALSAFLVLLRLFLAKGDYRLRFRDFKISGAMVKKIFKLGLPTGLQNSIVAIAHLLMTYFINMFTLPVRTGTYHYQMLDGYIYIPFNSMSVSLSAFVGQNVGAGRYDRVKKGVKACLMISMGLTAVMGTMMFLFGRNLLTLFEGLDGSSGTEAVMSAADKELMTATSLKFMTVMVLSYPILVVTDTLAGALRGAGQAFVPAVVTVGAMCGFRIIFLFSVMPFKNDIVVVYLSYTTSWTLSAVALVIYYLRGRWRNKAIVARDEATHNAQ
ncbi:MAG: MATE family efflux transporter [Firmicutes bacterium]|nr:MATE family efflux transporter [Bacillota bacterium]